MSSTERGISLHFILMDILAADHDCAISNQTVSYEDETVSNQTLLCRERAEGTEREKYSSADSVRMSDKACVSAGRNGLTLSEIMEQIDAYQADLVGNEQEPFDESTVRLKLKDYVNEGIVIREKQGRNICYRLSEQAPYIDREMLDFFSEAAPCGVIGSFLLDKYYDDNVSSDSEGTDPDGLSGSRTGIFSFKHHYITSAMDSEVLCALFTAMNEKCYVTLHNVSLRTKREMIYDHVVPLKIMISVQSGRQYLMAYVRRFNRIRSFRLDYIIAVGRQPEIHETAVNKQFADGDGLSEERYDRLQAELKRMLPHIWGVSTQGMSGDSLEHVEFTVRFSEDEQYIPKRLEREKRCGHVEQIDSGHCRFSADVYDAQELFTWIRTFICRITSLSFSREALEQQFRRDLEEMYALYGLTERTVECDEVQTALEPATDACESHEYAKDKAIDAIYKSKYAEAFEMIHGYNGMAAAETNYGCNGMTAADGLVNADSANAAQKPEQKLIKSPTKLQSMKSVVFSELYSAYYNAIAAVLRAAVDHPVHSAELSEIVRKCAFAESSLSITAEFMEQGCGLLRSDGSTLIRKAPSMPLTKLQKKWLAAIRLDPRFRLFADAACHSSVTAECLSETIMDRNLSEDDQLTVRGQSDKLKILTMAGSADRSEALEYIENLKEDALFTPDDYIVYDKYADGDDYEDESYIHNFSMVLDALRNRYPLIIEMENRKGSPIRKLILPQYLEYSEKDDKFRLIGSGKNFGGTINLGRIVRCEPYNKPWEDKLKVSEPRKREMLVIELTNERNALERVLMHFAHFEKMAEKLDDKQYRISISYDKEDETEMVIRVLSFGHLIRVAEPQHFYELVRERLIAQKSIDTVNT